MYGYRQSNGGLMTNLNSISSSISSIDTIGRRANARASADNLIGARSQSVASTSLLWKASKPDRHQTNNRTRDTGRYATSDIYYNRNRKLTSYCINSETALNFILVPLLLLTIARQVFDFLGQIWLQILINFFTIILLIVALFGVRQRRILYLALFSTWTLLNAVWNLTVICIHFKVRDVGVTEDLLSLYTGALSWWHSNGPGCLPHNIASIQPQINILQSDVVKTCSLDYHLIESTQAAMHAVLSLTSSLLSCCLISTFRSDPAYRNKNSENSAISYRLNNLMSDRSKVNQNPFPSHSHSRFGTNTASLRRAPNKNSSRSSQHSASSMRSARRRHRQQADGTLPTPRESTSSAQRSQKYGSLSSRRSSKRERRGDAASLTYGVASDRAGPSRTRLSSLSSAEYLPSYQPPHSSSANLLSSYGEISSIESQNNRTSRRSGRSRQTSIKSASRGNTNPTYAGSRSSICSHNANANNYDDLSYIYGYNSTNDENLYSASTSGGDPSRMRQPIYAPNSNGRMKPVNEDLQNEVNNNQMQSNHRDELDRRVHQNGKFTSDGANTFDSRGRRANGSLGASNQAQVYMNQRGSRHPIYSNHTGAGNSETPI